MALFMKKDNLINPPIIGISSMLLTVESGPLMDRKRSSVGHDYIEAIRLSGGIPLILPIVEDSNTIKEQIEVIDGLVLSGGEDVSPNLYHEEPGPKLGKTSPERDHYEVQLIQSAIERKKPILAICRGLQLLNVVFGGTLYQDIPSSIPSSLSHNQSESADFPTHKVTLQKNSKLHRILGEEGFLTNTIHHQAIKDLAFGLVASAHSPDGLIEGVESENDLFILGVQWHPELMYKSHPPMQKLFHALVNASMVRRQK
jgi:putative glutamine amidotransferase